MEFQIPVDIIKRMKGECTDRKKLFIEHMSDKELHSEYIKEFSKFHKRTNNLLKNWQGINRLFSKEYMWMAGKNMTMLKAIRKIQIKPA